MISERGWRIRSGEHHYYGPGSIPESGHTRRLRLLLILALDLWVSLPFCYPAKANILIFFTQAARTTNSI